jgi:hypothetical protein
MISSQWSVVACTAGASERNAERYHKHGDDFCCIADRVCVLPVGRRARTLAKRRFSRETACGQWACPHCSRRGRVRAALRDSDLAARAGKNFLRHMTRKKGIDMSASGPHSILKLVSLVVVVLMLGAIGYAGYISLVHWSGIGV